MCGVSFVEGNESSSGNCCDFALGQTVGMSNDADPVEIQEVKLQRQISNVTNVTAATHTTRPTSPVSMKRQTSNTTAVTQDTYITAPDESAEVVEDDPVSAQDATKPAFGYHLTQKMAIKLAR